MVVGRFTDRCFILYRDIIALAINVLMLIIGRTIIGLAIGVTSFSAPLYISEVALVNIEEFGDIKYCRRDFWYGGCLCN